MRDVALLLGPVAFQDFEIPSGVNFGGRQRLALYRLPGGSRVIDALGRDDAQISFAGIFAGPNATQRARSLDQLRVAGTALPLTWDVLFYTVLISNFYADYRNGWWIPYQIVCTVLRDEASTLPQPALERSHCVRGRCRSGPVISTGDSNGTECEHPWYGELHICSVLSCRRSVLHRELYGRSGGCPR
jgi:hypothetical protein